MAMNPMEEHRTSLENTVTALLTRLFESQGQPEAVKQVKADAEKLIGLDQQHIDMISSLVVQKAKSMLNDMGHY